MRGMTLASSLALLLLAGNVAAKEIRCNVHSDYDFHLTPKYVILTRDSGVPKAIVMRQGRLFVDDRWVTLSAPDHKRVADYEREARAVMPLAQQIGRDAAHIAFTTLGEVAAGFSSDPAATREKLAKARKQLDARLARSVTPTNFNGRDLGQGIGDAVSELLPSLVGDIVGGAVRAALSGDATRLERMENIDKDIEARIEPQARALEQRAEVLCMRMRTLDRIENGLDYRSPDGTGLNLLRIEADRAHAAD